MSAPTPVRLYIRPAAAVARAVRWVLTLAAGTAFAWLIGAMLTGATAVAATSPATTAGRSTTSTSKITDQPGWAGPAPRPVPAKPVAPQPESKPVTAPAPTESVWDRIAKCESGGKWHTNTGNGYHGGLQFKPSTWKAFGGTKYAPTADKASKAEQIEIAKKVQAKQGWGAWPTCSKKAGVSKSSKKSDDEKSTKKYKSNKKHDKKAEKAKDKKYSSKHKDKAKDKDSKYQAKSKKHDKKSSKAKTKSAKATKNWKLNTKPTLPAKPGGPVTVAAGDTLSKIAKDNKVAGGWKALYEANKKQLSDPSLIRPGMQLTLPAAK